MPGPNRLDDPESRYLVRYGAPLLLTYLVEKLAAFRFSPQAQAVLDDVVGLVDDPSGWSLGAWVRKGQQADGGLGVPQRDGLGT